RNFATNALENLRQAFDGWAQGFFRAAAMIRNNQSVHAVLDGKLRILTRDDAFDEEFAVNRIAQSLDEVPVRGQSVQTCNFRNIQSVNHRLPSRESREAS